MSTTTTTTSISDDAIATTRAEQAKAFDKMMVEKGSDDGLFRASMKAIRSGHVESNRLRMSIVVAGVFTDKIMYRDLIASFYAVTAALEDKLDELKAGDEICKKLDALNFRRKENYEKDLQNIFNNAPDWKEQVNAIVESNEAAMAYVTKIKQAKTGETLAGAAFCLWGALIIGGGAIFMPRAKKLCGPDAINLFENITGPGREERKQNFIQLWDSLASPNTPEFDNIVQKCGECMQGNNSLIASQKRNPWWTSYVVAAGVGIVAAVTYAWRRNSKA